MKLPRLSPDCELEHADIKLAKARPVANDLKPRIVAFVKVKVSTSAGCTNRSQC
jgi:hypothetical protein